MEGVDDDGGVSSVLDEEVFDFDVGGLGVDGFQFGGEEDGGFVGDVFVLGEGFADFLWVNRRS